MVLTKSEIAGKAIVIGSVQKGERPSTYDATVGTIIRQGSILSTPEYTLPPRGVVWVVSAETFALPDEVTGLATLRTTWTHEGVLALNVGVIDPGWNGPVAAALVNFSNENFVIKRGECFFRVLFHEHSPTAGIATTKTRTEYEAMILDRSKKFSKTFLNMESLVPEVSEAVFKLPQWALKVTVIGLLAALVLALLPIAYTLYFDGKASVAKLAVLEQQVQAIKDEISKDEATGDIQRRLSKLEARREAQRPKG